MIRPGRRSLTTAALPTVALVAALFTSPVHAIAIAQADVEGFVQLDPGRYVIDSWGGGAMQSEFSGSVGRILIRDAEYEPSTRIRNIVAPGASTRGQAFYFGGPPARVSGTTGASGEFSIRNTTDAPIDIAVQLFAAMSLSGSVGDDVAEFARATVAINVRTSGGASLRFLDGRPASGQLLQTELTTHDTGIGSAFSVETSTELLGFPRIGTLILTIPAAEDIIPSVSFNFISAVDLISASPDGAIVSIPAWPVDIDPDVPILVRFVPEPCSVPLVLSVLVALSIVARQQRRQCALRSDADPAA